MMGNLGRETDELGAGPQMELAHGWEIGRVLDALTGKRRLDLADFLRDRYEQRFFDPIALLEREAIRGINWTKGSPEPEATIRPYGFAIMSLACQMIETLESYRRGIPTTSKNDFCWMIKDDRHKSLPQLSCTEGEIPETEKAFKSFFSSYAGAFQQLDGELFFRKIRNPLLHQSQTRSGWKIQIHPYDEAVGKTAEVLDLSKKVLYRDSFVSQLRCCFTNFVEHLRRHADSDDIWKNPERKIWWITWLSDPEYVKEWWQKKQNEKTAS